jgi:putative nucleotidyltransferase-like protein
MHGLTSQHLVRKGNETAPPRAALPALLAAPEPHDETILRGLASLSRADIQVFLESVAFHGLEGLAHRAIGRLSPSSIDPWIRSSLRRKAARNTAAALSQTLFLAEILDALDRSATPVAVLRGLRACEAIYGDLSLRPFTSHTLLVLQEDREVARKVLLRLGYTEAGHEIFRRGGVTVKLRRDPFGVFPLHMESLFARATPGLVAGAPSLLFQPEDELHLLACQAVRHAFDRLIRLADVAHFVSRRRPDLDWDLLFHRARTCGTTRVLGWALRAMALVGVSVRAVDLPAPEPGGRVEDFLMRRVVEGRPLRYTGAALLWIASRTLGAPLLLLREFFKPSSLWPGIDRRGTQVSPRRIDFWSAARKRRGAGRQGGRHAG